jgi:hypothetical protein
MVGLVVTPWNMPVGRRSSHSNVSAVSRKKRQSPRCGGVKEDEWGSSRRNAIAIRIADLSEDDVMMQIE